MAGHYCTKELLGFFLSAQTCVINGFSAVVV